MCDTFAAIGSTGAVFAKNSDRSPTEAQVVEWSPARRRGHRVAAQYIEVDDADTLGVVLSRPTWLYGAEHGVNQHGLAIGNERVYSCRDLSGPPALIGMDLVRLTLERARDADAALEVLTSLLERHGQGGSGDPDHDDPYDSSFLLCDARGGWVVETSGRDWVAAPVAANAAISNRYTLGTAWTRASGSVVPGTSADDWHAPAVDTRLADHRLAATTACSVAGPAPATAVATLRHHGTHPWGAPCRADVPVAPPAEVGDDLSGVTVCMHIPGLQATTASMICRLPTDGGPVRAWACLGSPCAGVFVPFFVPVVPGFLGSEAWWRRTTVLRDRVDSDSDPDTLTAIRAVLDPLECELWAEADSLVEASPDEWASFGVSCGERLDDTFRALGVPEVPMP